MSPERYLLDTNVWIDFFKDANGPVARKIARTLPSRITTCSVVWAELLHGVCKYANQSRRRAAINEVLGPLVCHDFGRQDAEVYAHVRDELERRGQRIGPHDLLIAAIALRRQLILVTDNVAEFERVEGLKIENWRQPS